MFVLDGDMSIQGRVVGLATLDYYDDGIRAAILLTNPLLINDYETIDYYKSSKIYVILENGARFSEIRFSEDNLGSDE